MANSKAELLLTGCSLIMKDDISPHGWKIYENEIKFKKLKRIRAAPTLIGRPKTYDSTGVSGKGNR